MMNSSRSRYLVAYDITDNKRLNKIHKKVEAYAIGGQKSFYECWLTATEFDIFMQELNVILKREEDYLFIFSLPPNSTVKFFGTARLQSLSPFLII